MHNLGTFSKLVCLGLDLDRSRLRTYVLQDVTLLGRRSAALSTLSLLLRLVTWTPSDHGTFDEVDSKRIMVPWKYILSYDVSVEKNLISLANRTLIGLHFLVMLSLRAVDIYLVLSSSLLVTSRLISYKISFRMRSRLKRT